MSSQPTAGELDATFRTSRVLPFPPETVFQAFTRPDLLARWWGPEGFTNTFDVFEFRPGGCWKFVMHGPDGSNHLNASIFREVEASSRIVVEHVSQPHFVLTIRLTAQESGTRVD